MGLKDLRKNGAGSTTEQPAPVAPGKGSAKQLFPEVPVSHLVPQEDVQFKIYFAGEDSNQIDALRRAISPFVRLASYVEVMEWIYFQSIEHPELIEDLHAHFGTVLGTNVYTSGHRASCKTDGRILEWICQVTNQKAYKGPTYILRWMMERWSYISRVTKWKPLQIQTEMDPGGDGGFRARTSRH